MMTPDARSAYRVGYVSGYGFRALRGTGPCRDTHTPWTNFVPAWIDEADGGIDGPFHDLWRDGFNTGQQAAAQPDQPVGRADTTIAPPPQSGGDVAP
jgi:hypothetical protein